MKSLVTGASGYIGLEVLKTLSRKSCEIRALVRPNTDVAEIEKLTSDIAYGDLTGGLNGEEIFSEVDCIYHLAAGTSGSHYELMMNTVVATENLLKALDSKAVKRFVLVSSFSVYQMSAIQCGNILNERSPVETNLRARDSYAIGKIRQEELVIRECVKKKIPLVIVRPGKIYGPGTNPFLPQLGLKIPGVCFLLIGGRNILPLTHVSNCAEAIVSAGFAKVNDGEIFNIVDDDLPTQSQYMKIFEIKMGKLPRKIWIPYLMFKMMAYMLEIASRKTKGNVPSVITRYRAENLWKDLRYTNKKAKELLGWEPQISIERGIREMFESLRPPETPML